MAGISRKKVKTKKGIETRYTITYRDIFGHQHTSGIYKTKKEAKEVLKKFNKDKTDNSRITYGMIFEDFLKKVRKKNSDGTYTNYQNCYNKYFKKFDNINYDKIDSMYWQDFFDDLEINHSPHTAQYCLKMAKAAVNRFVKHDKIQKNIFDKIEKIQTPKADINHLLIEELLLILNTCKKAYPQYYALLYTFIGTGAREGEIFALNKSDYDRDKLKITINKQFTRNKLYQHPKTAASNRDIYIFKELAEVLDEHIETLKPDNPLLFPNNAGNYINATNFRERFWKKLLKICKIEKRVRLHDLRGSYTDMTLSSGLSVKFTQGQMGHSRCETTTNIYMRNNEDMIKTAQRKLNEIFENKECEQNVSIRQNSVKSKIIQFPKNRIRSNF